MSQSFYLCCPSQKSYVWVGQGHEGVMESFYSGEPDTMDCLEAFLRTTVGKQLVLSVDDYVPDDFTEFKISDAPIDIEADVAVIPFVFELPDSKI